MYKNIHAWFWLILFIGCLICGLNCSSEQISEKDAEAIMKEFYSAQVPEPIIKAPLVSAGRKIVPYFSKEVLNRKMQKRGYAILALGEIGDRRALDSLKKVLDDQSEEKDFRECALRAIWHIDRKLGEEYARRYEGKNKDMDRTIKLLKDGKM
jgi:HEAT repeat protein